MESRPTFPAFLFLFSCAALGLVRFFPTHGTYSFSAIEARVTAAQRERAEISNKLGERQAQ